jgi:hypothetical protein
VPGTIDALPRVQADCLGEAHKKVWVNVTMAMRHGPGGDHGEGHIRRRDGVFRIVDCLNQVSEARYLRDTWIRIEARSGF